MNWTEWLKNFVFLHTRNPQRTPDGRPLYAYCCRDKFYEELKQKLMAAPAMQRMEGSTDGSIQAAFCLYAAETFRREHQGGAWTWDTIFQPLN
ncbi:MAG: hypothetical protein ACR2HF_11350, partial [Methylococcaceae bacterium]